MRCHFLEFADVSFKVLCFYQLLSSLIIFNLFCTIEKVKNKLAIDGRTYGAIITIHHPKHTFNYDKTKISN